MIDIALRQGKVDQIQLWRRSFSEAVSDPTIIVGSAWAQIFSHDQKQAAALLTELRDLSAGLSDATARRRKTARESRRARVCQYVSFSVAAVVLKIQHST